MSFRTECNFERSDEIFNYNDKPKITHNKRRREKYYIKDNLFSCLFLKGRYVMDYFHKYINHFNFVYNVFQHIID